MKELSLNILDIVQNSVKAEATLIEIIIDENIDDDKLTIVVSDNGCGMSPEFLSRVRVPVYNDKNYTKGWYGNTAF